MRTRLRRFTRATPEKQEEKDMHKTLRTLKVVLIAALLGASAASSAQQGLSERWQTFGAPAPGSEAVNPGWAGAMFYRTGGGGGAANIYVNGEYLASLLPGGYRYAELCPYNQRLAAAQPRWQQTRAYDHTLRHQCEQLASLEQSAAAHTAAQTALAAAEKHAAAARENSARADVARKKTETALAAHLQGRLLREYRAEKDNILRELAYHQRIADLEQQRAHLHDGEPCPLCGATEHPYASELPAQPDDLTARLETLDTYIKRAETLGEQHENAQRALASAREKQQQTENTLALAAEKARNSAVHAEQHAALQQTHAQTLAARQALLANRDPDAEETAQQHAIAEAEAAMEKARDTCQTAQSAAAANQQQRAQLHARLTAQQQELQTAEQQFAAALGMCSEIAAPSPAGRSPQRGRAGEGCENRVATAFKTKCKQPLKEKSRTKRDFSGAKRADFYSFSPFFTASTRSP